MYTGTYLKVMCLRMDRWRRNEKRYEVECVKENSLRKMEFAIVLCGAQFASGITIGICLKSSAWGYVLTCDFYDITGRQLLFY